MGTRFKNQPNELATNPQPRRLCRPHRDRMNWMRLPAFSKHPKGPRLDVQQQEFNMDTEPLMVQKSQTTTWDVKNLGK